MRRSLLPSGVPSLNSRLFSCFVSTEVWLRNGFQRNWRSPMSVRSTPWSYLRVCGYVLFDYIIYKCECICACQWESLHAYKNRSIDSFHFTYFAQNEEPKKRVECMWVDDFTSLGWRRRKWGLNMRTREGCLSLILFCLRHYKGCCCCSSTVAGESTLAQAVQPFRSDLDSAEFQLIWIYRSANGWEECSILVMIYRPILIASIENVTPLRSAKVFSYHETFVPFKVCSMDTLYDSDLYGWEVSVCTTNQTMKDRRMERRTKFECSKWWHAYTDWQRWGDAITSLGIWCSLLMVDDLSASGGWWNHQKMLLIKPVLTSHWTVRLSNFTRRMAEMHSNVRTASFVIQTSCVQCMHIDFLSSIWFVLSPSPSPSPYVFDDEYHQRYYHHWWWQNIFPDDLLE